MSKKQPISILLCDTDAQWIKETASSMERQISKIPTIHAVIISAETMKHAYHALSEQTFEWLILPKEWLQESNRDFFTYLQTQHPLIRLVVVTTEKTEGLPTLQGVTPHHYKPKQTLASHMASLVMDANGGASDVFDSLPTIVRQGVFAFYSPKGGTGKTTFIANLARRLSEYENHAHEDITVCVVDLDVERGNLSIHLNVPPHPNVLSWVEYLIESKTMNGKMRNPKIRFEEYKQFLTRIPNTSVYVLPAPMYPHQFDTLVRDETLLRMMLTNLKQHFDVVLIDIGSTLNHPTTAVAMDMADTLFLLVRPEEADMYTADSFLQTAKEHQLFSFEQVKLLWVSPKIIVDSRWIDAFRIEESLKEKWLCGVIPFTPEQEMHKAYATSVQAVVKRMVPNGHPKSSLIYKAKKWFSK